MTQVDRSIVREGYPNGLGLHLLWSVQAGWPVIDIVRVTLLDGRTYFWKGTESTERTYELKAMYGMWRDGYLGHSKMVPEALTYYESWWDGVSNPLRRVAEEEARRRHW